MQLTIITEQGLDSTEIEILKLLIAKAEAKRKTPTPAVASFMQATNEILSEAPPLSQTALIESLLNQAGSGVVQTPLSQIAPSTAAASLQVSAPVAPQPTATSPTASPTSAAPANPTEPAAPTAPATGAETDSTGLIWDARIHSSSKAKNANGTWRARKGINDPGLVKRVEAELRAAADTCTAPINNLASPMQQLVVPAADPVYTATLDPAAVFGGAAAQTPLPLTAPGVAIAPVATENAAGNPLEPTTFAELMPRVSAAVTAGKLAPTALQEACVLCGLPNVVALATNPAMVPNVWAMLQSAEC